MLNIWEEELIGFIRLVGREINIIHTPTSTLYQMQIFKYEIIKRYLIISFTSHTDNRSSLKLFK